MINKMRTQIIEKISILCGKFLSRYYNTGGIRASFSQTGEDLIITDYLLSELKLDPNTIRYLDIGSNHPIKLNNTYLLSLKGATGVLVEPNPELFELLKSKRKRDIVINKGVSDVPSCLEYYMFTENKINSFSEVEANEYIGMGYKLVDRKDIEVIPVNSIFEKYGYFDFISIDVEGLDMNIIKSIDYTKYAPRIICIETCEHNGGKYSEFEDLVRFMRSNGYSVYADDMLNTMFVKENEVIAKLKR